MTDTISILMIGDIVAKAGYLALRKALPGLIANNKIDFVVANGENIAGGLGITPEHADDLFKHGVNVITSGNHIWRQREIRKYIENCEALLRPHNFHKSQPGKGYGIFETPGGVKIGVINLCGQVFMDQYPDNPFFSADDLLKQLKDIKIILIDFHAEATSEKRALGYYLDGKVSVVAGTHTHVQTADEQILAGGTAFITDLGMTGPHDSVIGMNTDLIIQRFLTGLPETFKPSKKQPRFQGALIEIETATGKAVSIKRLDIPV